MDDPRRNSYKQVSPLFQVPFTLQAPVHVKHKKTRHVKRKKTRQSDFRSTANVL